MATLIIVFPVVLLVIIANNGYAQVITGPADAGRIKPAQRDITVPFHEEEIKPVTPPSIAPENANKIHFILKGIKIEGMKIFKTEDVKKIYKDQINKNISLEDIWNIAAKLNEQYYKKGYFLAYAFVPEQEIENGIVRIKVVEGYISKVKYEGIYQDSGVVRKIINNIVSERPSTMPNLESSILRLKDVSGISYKAILDPAEDKDKTGGVTLLITPDQKKDDRTAKLSFDNYGSRFLGPYQLSLYYQNNPVPMQKTSLYGIISQPTDELKAFNINHEIALSPAYSFDLSGGYTSALPGFSLEPSDVDSSSTNIGFGISNQIIRQRLKNLKLSIGFEGRNTNRDLSDSTLTRDKIRKIRISLKYNQSDSYFGYNFLNIDFDQGVRFLGASDKDDQNLSRTDAKADYSKIGFDYSRLQGITNHWSGVASLKGQLASGSLFSSEEFGFGGIDFGKAYDQSEILGDNGLACAIELRYDGFNNYMNFKPSPYIFYDIGKVWNDNTGQDKDTSASSAGFGMKLLNNKGIAVNMIAAMPLTKNIDTPVYGNNGKNARILFQISYDFYTPVNN